MEHLKGSILSSRVLWSIIFMLSWNSAWRHLLHKYAIKMHSYVTHWKEKRHHRFDCFMLRNANTHSKFMFLTIVIKGAGPATISFVKSVMSYSMIYCMCVDRFLCHLTHIFGYSKQTYISIFTQQIWDRQENLCSIFAFFFSLKPTGKQQSDMYFSFLNYPMSWLSLWKQDCINLCDVNFISAVLFLHNLKCSAYINCSSFLSLTEMNA